MNSNILITGFPGIGKTTLIKKIVNELIGQGKECTGFYTEEVRSNNSRIGFDIVTLAGDREILARKSSASNTPRPKVGQYEVYLNEFEKLALPVLLKPGQVIVIHEVGKMELFSKKFETLVKEIFKKKNVQIIATVPVKGNINLVEQLKQSENCQLFTVNFDNRNTIKHDILSLIVS